MPNPGHREGVALLDRACQDAATVSKTDGAPDLLPASLPQGGFEQRPPVHPVGPFVRLVHIDSVTGGNAGGQIDSLERAVGPRLIQGFATAAPFFRHPTASVATPGGSGTEGDLFRTPYTAKRRIRARDLLPQSAEALSNIELKGICHRGNVRSMTAQREFEKLKTLSTMPVENRAAWLSGAADAKPFLISNATADYVVVYASMPAAFILAVLAPAADLTPTNKTELANCHLGVESTWRIQRVSGGGEPRQIYLERPLASSFTDLLIDGEPIVTRRDFHGMSDHRAPVELNQRIIHALDLHWVAERSAFCQLDNRGDLIDVIWLCEVAGETDWDTTTVVFFEARRLAEYMAVTDQAIFRKFDFTRTAPESFGGWNGREFGDFDSPDLFFNGGVMLGQASYIHGGQVIRASITVKDMVAEWEAEVTRPKEYETFKIHDFHSGSLVEVSAGPEGVRNYFTEADKPFETSPAFFRAEVLNRYKADPDKYEVTSRSITCRNAWFLKSYDLNEEGQVHTLICDLAALPIDEQRYWKLFNEWPKGPISKRSYQTDFLGEWVDPDPLQSIKQTVSDWDGRKPKWWTPRGREAAERVLYPASGAAKEWGDELLALDQLVVEGFAAKELKSIAAHMALTIDPGWGSLKLLEAIMVGSGVGSDEAAQTLEPLKQLHYLRSKVKGHAAPELRRRLEGEAIAKHQTFHAHFDALARGCDNAMIRIVAVLDAVQPQKNSQT